MNNANIKLFQHFIILSSAMLACGFLSLLFGKELGWDLANYHYYHPYAVLANRSQLDFWPASFIHQFINPAIDFFSYFLINYFSPAAVEFILGAIHGINFWLLFVIAHLFVGRLAAFVIAFFGMYGPAALPGIGSFQNDNLVSIFVLSSVLIYIKGLTLPNISHTRNHFILAGFLLGIGIGLKLTAAIFIPGVIFATLTLSMPMTNRLKLLLFSGIFFAAGLLLSSGYWMYLMWEKYHHPLFPFFNNLFHAPHLSLVNWRDTRFLPQGIWQTIFFPFYFSWDGKTSDGGFRDFRFLIIYILLLIISCLYLLSFFKKNRKIVIHPQNIMGKWLSIFFICSYAAWQYYFSIARYLTPLEMLAPLLIYLLIEQLPIRSSMQTVSLILVFYVLLFFMSPITVARERWYDTTFFNVKLPDKVMQTQKALVFIAYAVYMQGKPWLDANPRPQAYLIPYFPPNWQFIGIPFGHEKYLKDNELEQKIHQLLQAYSYPIYLLTSNINMPELYRTASSLGLTKAGPCEKIFSDRQKVTGQEVWLCPVAKLN